MARELVELLPDHSIVDGELVALASGPRGEPGQDFNRLEGTVFGRSEDRLSLVVFDAAQAAVVLCRLLLAQALTRGFRAFSAGLTGDRFLQFLDQELAQFLGGQIRRGIGPARPG